MENLTDIAVFVRVVERGSFTLAADDLELSRAVVSKYVSRLEGRLGARLLQRTTRRLSLTEAGAALFEASRGALERIDEAEAAIARLQSAPRGRLRVSAPMSFGILHFGPLIAEFSRLHPAVSLELVFDDRFVNLVEEGVDVAVRIGTLADSTLVARKLSSAQMVVCAAPSYLAQHGEPELPEDLAGHNCLLYSYLSTANIWRFTSPDGREIAVPVNGNLRANNGIVEAEAALAGMGILMTPSFYVARSIRGGKLTRILTGYRLPAIGIHAVYPQREHVPPKVRAFVDFLAERFAGTPPWERS
ncbi:MAG TPA: LysR substrate-binding domain-containing protein [Usitatibacter sp.]|nr:LysR substrate-binding domain-containing protein [Usitatibacter sp.]